MNLSWPFDFDHGFHNQGLHAEIIMKKTWAKSWIDALKSGYDFDLSYRYLKLFQKQIFILK